MSGATRVPPAPPIKTGVVVALVKVLVVVLVEVLVMVVEGPAVPRVRYAPPATTMATTTTATAATDALTPFLFRIMLEEGAQSWRICMSPKESIVIVEKYSIYVSSAYGLEAQQHGHPEDASIVS